MRRKEELARYYGLNVLRHDFKNKNYSMVRTTPDMDKLLAAIT